MQLVGRQDLYFAEAAFFIAPDGAQIRHVRIENNFAGALGSEEVPKQQRDRSRACLQHETSPMNWSIP